MKRLLVLMLFATSAFAQTTVTGTVMDPSGGVATSGYVQFDIVPRSSSIMYRVAGTGVLVPPTAKCGINASGQIKKCATASCTAGGADPCMIYGGDVITPGNTAYDVTFVPNNSITNQRVIRQVLIFGTAYDLNSPTFSPSITIVPQYQTITTSPIAVNLVPAAPHVFTVGQQGLEYSQGWFDNLFVGGVAVQSINLCSLSNKTEATASARFQSCILDLDSTGGTVIADMEGAQTIATDVFTGVTKPVHLIIASGQYSHSVSTVYPPNISLEFKQGAKFVIPTGVTVAIRGSLVNPPKSQIFSQSGTGKVIFEGTAAIVFNSKQGRVDPRWWGADFSGSCTSATSAINAAITSLNNRGGTIIVEGYACSDAPTFTGAVGAYWTVFEVTGRWDWNTQLLLTPGVGVRVLFRGMGGTSNQSRQSSPLAMIGIGPSWSSGDVALIKQTSAGAVIFENISLIHNRNAPVYHCVNGAATRFNGAQIYNNNASAAAHAVLLDGCFWQYFDHVATNAAGGAVGAYNYVITATSASTQDPGLTSIYNGQLNSSGILISSSRAITGAITTLDILGNTTMEGATTTAFLTIDLTNNIHGAINHINLTGVNADSVAPGDMLECIGTATTNTRMRDVFVNNSFFTVPATGCPNILNFVIEGTHPFTGAIDISNQRNWVGLFDPLDAAWFYSSSRMTPSWTPYAAVNSVPSQAGAAWAGYSELTAVTTTVTTGILAPDGSTSAFRMTCDAAGTCGRYVDFNLTLTNGDWIEVGSHFRSNSTTAHVRDDAFILQFTGGCAFGDDGNGIAAGKGDSNLPGLHGRAYKVIGTNRGWFASSGLIKITNAVSNPCTVRAILGLDSTRPTEFWKPHVRQIPVALGVPDGDVIRAWRAGLFETGDVDCLANELCAASDQPLSVNTLKSRVATGTAPLAVASTTKVANLNVDQLDDATTAAAGTASTVALRDANGRLTSKRFIADGTALVAADFGTNPTANWGAGAAYSGIIGTDQGFQLTITAAGTPGANPTIPYTYKDGTWGSSPIFICKQVGGTGAVNDITGENTATATAMTLTWNGTPVAGLTYIVNCIAMGR